MTAVQIYELFHIYSHQPYVSSTLLSGIRGKYKPFLLKHRSRDREKAVRNKFAWDSVQYSIFIEFVALVQLYFVRLLKISKLMEQLRNCFVLHFEISRDLSCIQ